MGAVKTSKILQNLRILEKKSWLIEVIGKNSDLKIVTNNSDLMNWKKTNMNSLSSDFSIVPLKSIWCDTFSVSKTGFFLKHISY